MPNRKNNLTEGPIWKALVLFALPVLLGNIFQQFYNAFDAWCVGNYIGDDALAAVSSSGSLIFMMVSFFNGLSMGAGVVIARNFGAKEFGAMRKAIHTNIAFGLITGSLLTVIGINLTPYILTWMGTPAEVMPQSVEYFKFYFSGALFSVMYNICVGILHAVGDSKHPLIYLIISTCVNMGLDMLFVGVLGWGVGSAAVATAISQFVSAALCIIHLLRVKAPYQLKLPELRIHKKSLLEIIRFGLPSGVQNSVIALANVVVQSNINSFGKEAMAGCGSYSKLEGFAFLPITCFTMALSTFVGQNLGAKKYDRVKKGVGFGIFSAMILAEIVGLVSYLFAPTLIGLFNKNPDVIDYGVSHMRTICLFYFLLAFSHCIASILRGAGKATIPMLTMLVCWCLIRVTYITIAVNYVVELTTVSWGSIQFPFISFVQRQAASLTIVSWAYPLTWFLSSSFFLVYFLKADWIHNFDRIAAKNK